jgi:hypothetical protein
MSTSRTKSFALAGLLLLSALPAFAGVEVPAPHAFSPTRLWPLIVVPGAILWVVLAFERARRLDPNYPRARARALLARHLGRLGPTPTPAELETWCELTARLLAITRAAPTRWDVFDGLAMAGEITDPMAWQRLWTEARAALFGADHHLPADWVARARVALGQTVILRANPVFPKKREHWLPRRLVLAGLLLLTPLPTKAQAVPDPLAPVLGQLAAHPRDWSAHEQAAVLYAQGENWDAALAHGTAAFVLAPREESVADHLRKTLTQVERVDPGLRPLIAGNRVERIAAFASPGEWQEAAWCFLGLAVVGGCIVVVGFYLGRGWLRGGLVALVMGGGGVAVAARALELYGLLAKPNAACLTRQTDVRDIPSDLVEIRQTAPLQAGTIVTVEGNYFGWTRIVGRGNLTGWVRRDAVLPLYTAAEETGASGFRMTKS